MIPGPDYIIGCPSCGEPHRRGSLMSGNTSGARWWSDGKREAPMLPSRPLVVRCRGCSRYFWLSRGEPLGTIAPFHFQPVPVRDVLLTDVGPRRIEVMATLRRVLGVELHEAKALLERVPLELASDVTRSDAGKLIEEFQKAGATARVRPVWAPPEPPRVSNHYLVAVGPRRLEIMALLREHFGVSLSEVKQLLERLPLELHPRGGLGFHQLDELIKRYRAAGAVLERYPLPPSPKPAPLPGEELPPEWLELPGMEELPEADLLAALAQGVTQDRDEERELRSMAWWASNDPYREPGATWKPFAEREPAAWENLRALQELLDPQEPLERWMKAEALRELERFDEARELLTWEPPQPELQQVAAYLRELAEQRVPEVRVVVGS
ncbi:ribosomal protein L7/L12 [Archangium lansingense]|uniref:ribosomal protein L7/L12 n=1 Tax=Archangium lansingense TaxID=2995310 RepID=UPI003B771530